jgi:4-amino-4-deoxy-L-arabinose transferase-like glycosyltransferase
VSHAYDAAGRQYASWAKNKLELLMVHKQYVALAVLILIVTLISIVWNSLDTRPMPIIDAHVYLARTFEFVNVVERRGIAHLWQAIADVSWLGRPPLYQLLSVPFIWLFGRSMDAALTVNIVFQALLLLSTYGIGRLVKNGSVGLLAALLAAAYPPIINLSRFYMTQYGAVACVALSLCLLLLLLKTRSVKVAWLFGLSLGFGALVCHYFPYFLSAPTVVFGLYMVLFQTDPRRPAAVKEIPVWMLSKGRDPFVLRGLLPAALIATALTAPWYLTRARGLLTFVGSAVAEGGVPRYFAGGVPVFSSVELTMASGEFATREFPDVNPSSVWWYALTMPGAVSNVFAVFVAIGLVVGIVKRQLPASVLVLAFLVAYSVLPLWAIRMWMLLTPILPAAAALAAYWVVDIGDWALSTRVGQSRIARVAEVNREDGQITAIQSDGSIVTLRLRPDHALWASIDRGTVLQITRQSGADGKTRHVVRLPRPRRISRLVSGALILVCVSVSVFVFSVVTWGVGAWGTTVAGALGMPLDPVTCSNRFSLAFCPNPAIDENWHLRDVLEVALQDPECESRNCRLMVVSAAREFHGSAFRYYLAQDLPDSRIRVAVPGRTRTHYNFDVVLTSDYVVYTTLKEGEACVEGIPLVCVIEFLQSPPAIFANAHKVTASFPLPLGQTAELLKRTKPLTYEEARLSIEAVDLPEGVKSQLLAEIEDLPMSH